MNRNATHFLYVIFQSFLHDGLVRCSAVFVCQRRNAPGYQVSPFVFKCGGSDGQTTNTKYRSVTSVDRKEGSGLLVNIGVTETIRSIRKTKKNINNASNVCYTIRSM